MLGVFVVLRAVLQIPEQLWTHTPSGCIWDGGALDTPSACI